MHNLCYCTTLCSTLLYYILPSWYTAATAVILHIIHPLCITMQQPRSRPDMVATLTYRLHSLSPTVPLSIHSFLPSFLPFSYHPSLYLTLSAFSIASHPPPTQRAREYPSGSMRHSTPYSPGVEMGNEEQGEEQNESSRRERSGQFSSARGHERECGCRIFCMMKGVQGEAPQHTVQHSNVWWGLYLSVYTPLLQTAAGLPLPGSGYHFRHPLCPSASALHLLPTAQSIPT